MPEFTYQEPFPLEKDETEYRLLTSDHVSVSEFAGQEILVVEPEALRRLAREGFRDVSFLLRPAHLEKVAAILTDPESSANDRGVAMALLHNARTAAKGVLPLCQDTGTAIVLGKKGQQVWTGADDAEALSRGIYETYAEENLRYSQTIPLTMYEEKNSGTNLPAQIDLLATAGMEYKFLLLTKGGGSGNKTYLFQETKALLNPESLEKFLLAKMRTLGTAACPPYHLAFVIGGTSAETCLKTVKLASAKYYDALPTTGNEHGRAFRDIELEAEVLEMTRKAGIGAQFGGRHFCHDVRVIRLPRHGASCPCGIGVSCSADRNMLARIDRAGVWLEKLEADPSRFMVEGEHGGGVRPVPIDLNQPMEAIRARLSGLKVGDVVSLNGPIVVGRDIAHGVLLEILERTGDLPQYVKDHPIYYAGPAKTPQGWPSGSFGPTTAQRMDSYVEPFQAAGGSLVMLAKGNRGQEVTDACAKNGGFYLGSIGGPAARLGRDCIKKVEVLAYEELGMEAIFKIEVEHFPAFVIVDDKGNDFFARFRDPTPLVQLGG